MMKIAASWQISDLFPIFPKKWFAFSLATRHNVGNNSPSQARHHSTVQRHLTPNNRFQNTPKTTYVKWSTMIQTTLPQTLACMDGERMRAYRDTFLSSRATSRGAYNNDSGRLLCRSRNCQDLTPSPLASAPAWGCPPSSWWPASP